ncbi:MAG: AbgT family transporter [Lachnospiraceae bacterium]|nr:AbgT family transporter [Lachnospiraceae bacterium]
MKQIQETEKKTGWLMRTLNGIEWLGNKLPHPITIFFWLTVLTVLISAVCERAGVSAVGEVIDTSTLEVKEQTISAVSLLNGEGIAYMLTHMVSNFTGFAPLGVVLLTMLGVGCAEGSGYLTALMKKGVSVTPGKIVTPMLVFLGVMSNVASDIGYVVLIPLGAMIFMSYGRHPLAGLAASFAGVSGGYSANLIIGALEPMLAGISTEAAGMIDPDYVVAPTANWYFIMASTVVIVIIGTWVTDKLVEPRLGSAGQTEENVREAAALTGTERRALLWANISLLVLTTVFVTAAIPENSFLRNPVTGSLINGSPLMNGLIAIIALLFFVPSYVYGRLSGSLPDEKAVCVQLGKNMEAMGAYIALSFMASQFINYFNYTKLGSILALKGADVLSQSGLNGVALILLFIVLSALLNLVMGSASAKWKILAPVFVPMFMLLGYSPELTQVSYRIGDSCTNLVTPLMSYFAMIVVAAQRYDKEAGIGTLIAMMLPYSICFLIGWSLLLGIWMLLGLPLGPGAPLYL